MHAQHAAARRGSGVCVPARANTRPIGYLYYGSWLVAVLRCVSSAVGALGLSRGSSSHCRGLSRGSSARCPGAGPELRQRRRVARSCPPHLPHTASCAQLVCARCAALCVGVGVSLGSTIADVRPASPPPRYEGNGCLPFLAAGGAKSQRPAAVARFAFCVAFISAAAVRRGDCVRRKRSAGSRCAATRIPRCCTVAQSLVYPEALVPQLPGALGAIAFRS